MTGVLIRRGETQTHERMTEADAGVMLADVGISKPRKAKDCRPPPEAGTGREGFSSTVFRGSSALPSP